MTNCHQVVGDVDFGLGETVLEHLFYYLAIRFRTATRAIIMDGLDSVGMWRKTLRPYKMFKGLNIRVIRIEAIRYETLCDRVPVQENPFHFGGAAVNNQFHASSISEGVRLMSKG